MKNIIKNKLLFAFFSIIFILGAHHVKASFAAEPHGDEHLHKYAQNSAFDASFPIKTNGNNDCSASRIKIGEDDPVDFYLTAAHCMRGGSRRLSILQEADVQSLQQKEINYIRHPKQDLLIFTNYERSNQLKYNPYTGNLKDLVGKTVTQVAFGSSLLDETSQVRKRQAFDSIIESVNDNNQFFSIAFMPDSNNILENNPIGITTPGDSGGSLLVKEQEEYKLIGAVHGIDFPENFTGDSTSIYNNIPEYLRSNSHNRLCFRSRVVDKPCYGARTIWPGIDLKFIEDAKRILLSKKPVYVYQPQTEEGYPIVTFLLKDHKIVKNANIDHLKNEKNLIGYAFEDASLVVSIDRAAFCTIPLQVGNTYFTYQLAGKHYPIQVTVGQSTDGKSFIVKGIIRSQEQNRSTANNPTDSLIANSNGHYNITPSFAKPVYLSDNISNDLPLEISLDKCLFNGDVIDVDPIGNAEVLGYVGSNYELVISLNGQELKRFKTFELIYGETNFKCEYSGNTYKVEVSEPKQQSNGSIFLKVEAFNVLEKEFYSLAETTSAFPNSAPVYFTRSCGIAGDVPISIKLSLDTAGYIELFTADVLAQKWPVSEGCHRITYKNNGIVYAVEVNIQKYDVPAEHYSVDLTVKELHRELSPAMVNNSFTFNLPFKTDDSCENERAGILVKYYDRTSREIADNLKLVAILDKDFQQIFLEDHGILGIGYGNKSSNICILLDGKELGRFGLDPSIEQQSAIKFEKDGKSYSLDIEMSLEWLDNIPFIVILDVKENDL